MSSGVAYRHADWLSLVEPTGSFLTLPVLNRAFPVGLTRLSALRRREVLAGRESVALGDSAAMTGWIEWVLRDLLGWGDRLRSGPAVPPGRSLIVPGQGILLRPDHVLVEPHGESERVRALVLRWPAGTRFDLRAPGDGWSATPSERAAQLCRATGVPLALVTDGDQWRVVWAPVDGPPGEATFHVDLFAEEPALLDALVALVSAHRFFSVQPHDTIEALLTESAAAQEVVADQLGKQVRAAAEHLVAAVSRANRDRDGELLEGLSGAEVYEGTVTVLMRLVFLLFAEERGLLPLDDELYARSYALCTLRDQLQAERDLYGDEPLERRSTAWFRLLALFRAVHGGLTHDTLRIPPYGGRLFDPDRFPFLEGRTPGGTWRNDPAAPIPVDDLTMLEVLNSLQVLQFTDGGVREARQLSYRTLEVEQIGHVYEGLLDHSIRRVEEITLGLVGKQGDEPEVPLSELETAAAGGRDDLVKWLKATTGRTDKQIAKLLDEPPGDNDRQLLAAAVDNDETLTDRLLPYVHLLRRDLRELPIVMLDGAVYVTQTSTRREGGVEYTTKDLADEVAQYALEPLVYSPGPQDGAQPEDWRLRPSAELLDLKICDPAVGSGAILVAAGRYLADRVVEAWTAEEADEAVGADDEVRLTARRVVADRCLYGVDRDPLATEMAKLSLWLITMAKDRPFTFLDHSIRTGDALLGVTDIRQVKWMHLDPYAGQNLHMILDQPMEALDPIVRSALERRRRLAEIRVITVRDAEDKARLTAEADADLQTLRIIADLVCAATLSTATGKKSDLDHQLQSAAQGVAAALADGLDDDQRRLLLDQLAERAASALNAGKPDAAPVRRCLHWPLEFPEVFLDRDEPGFHFVGNPPFVGGKKISGAAGSDYREYLVTQVAGGVKGNADLVAYFFLRATTVGRSLGFLATNTIAQGDTSEVGLAQMLDSGWSIYRAVSSTPWPGQASLEISKVWASAERFAGSSSLDGVEVAVIDEMLYPGPEGGWRKMRLAESDGRAFIGVLLNGSGFAVDLEAAEQLRLTDPASADVLLPYLNGDDVTKHPQHLASRQVIAFWDLPREVAEKRYPACFEIVEREVKPQRLQIEDPKKAKVRDEWWRFEKTAPGMRAAVQGLPRFMVMANTAKYQVPAFVEGSVLPSHMLVVFAYADDFQFGLLTSGFHTRWAARYSSTLETRLRYTPTDVFETFPQAAADQSVAGRGKDLNEHRAALMVSANEGLTATYNRVHDPDDSTPGIVQLRELHRELDLAVRDAYGWSDLNLEHGFHPVRGQGIRYTFSPAAATEVLERLLELNKERYEDEFERGLHGTVKKKAPAKKKAAAPAEDALDLFSDAGGDEGDDA